MKSVPMIVRVVSAEPTRVLVGLRLLIVDAVTIVNVRALLLATSHWSLEPTVMVPGVASMVEGTMTVLLVFVWLTRAVKLLELLNQIRRPQPVDGL